MSHGTLTAFLTILVVVNFQIMPVQKADERQSDASDSTKKNANDLANRYFTDALPNMKPWGERLSHHSLPITESGKQSALAILEQHRAKSLLGTKIEKEKVAGVRLDTANEIFVSTTRVGYHWWYKRTEFLYHVYIHVDLTDQKISLVGHEGIAD